MSRTTIILTLLFAATLEAADDAVIRMGMHAHQTWRRAFLFGVGTIILFLYGWTVNSPPWDFGKLLGLYVVFSLSSLNSSRGSCSKRLPLQWSWQAEP